MAETTEAPNSQNKRLSVATANNDDVAAPSTYGPVTRLSLSDHSYLIHALAGTPNTSSTADPEQSLLPHPHSTIYPPRGLPSSLYRTVVESRTTSSYQYLISTLIFDLSLILQLLLGAALTALGSSSNPNITNTPITILAAANTINAGILALLHNSGLPDRFKKDRDEFVRVELSIREVLETGVVKGKQVVVEEVVEEMWEMYREAVRTVARNKPANYVASASGGSNAVTREKP